MRPKTALWTLGCHAGLLVLASTRFSAVSWIWGRGSWRWDYMQYSYRNGWGYVYRTDYSLAVVLAYLAAYSAGIAVYSMAGKCVSTRWIGLAILLCVLGLVSFLIEGSHWLWDHHLSLVATCPAASLLLALIIIVQLGRAGGRPAPKAGSADAPATAVN